MVIGEAETHTISLRSFGSLIIEHGRQARVQEDRVDQILEHFHRGDYRNIEEFERIVDQLINNTLESIKIYAERDEYEQLEIIKKFLTKLLSDVGFTKIDLAYIDDVARKYMGTLNHIAEKYHRERKSERRLRGGGKPVGATLSKLLRDNQSRERKAIIGGRRIILHENQEKELMGDIHGHLRTLESEIISPKKRKQEGSATHHLLVNCADHFMDQFDALFNIESNIELVQADLVDEIDDLLKKLKPGTPNYNMLDAIKNRALSSFRRDYAAARRGDRRARSLASTFGEKFRIVLSTKRQAIKKMKEELSKIGK